MSSYSLKPKECLPIKLKFFKIVTTLICNIATSKKSWNMPESAESYYNTIGEWGYPSKRFDNIK